MALLDRRDERLDALSKGNQQRVQLGAALLHRPRLAILDEPFAGLDPISQESFLDLVRELRDGGTAVLLSAHQMDLVERVADRALLLNRGRTILAGSLAELRQRLDPRAADGAALAGDRDVEEHETEGEALHLTLRQGAAVPAFLARAATMVALQGIAIEHPRLHDVFVRAVREDDARSGKTGAGAAA
jgi:ABC-2 type transport system ATP-binding protein